MSTLSVPLPVHLEEFVDQMVTRGYGTNKADVVRRALNRLAEEEAIKSVIQAEQEIREGKIVKGDLKKILKSLT
jgi:putative addiction module CopG family antidote